MRGEAFDTSVLVYAITKDDPRTATALELLADGGMVSVQVLSEFVAVARRKFQMPWKEVEEALAIIRTLCAPPVAITADTHAAALHIAQRYGFHFYDSLILAAGIQAGCQTIYSEDMQHGQVIGPITIRNPFGRGKRHH